MEQSNIFTSNDTDPYIFSGEEIQNIISTLQFLKQNNENNTSNSRYMCLFHVLQSVVNSMRSQYHSENHQSASITEVEPYLNNHLFNTQQYSTLCVQFIALRYILEKKQLPQIGMVTLKMQNDLHSLKPQSQTQAPIPIPIQAQPNSVKEYIQTCIATIQSPLRYSYLILGSQFNCQRLSFHDIQSEENRLIIKKERDRLLESNCFIQNHIPKLFKNNNMSPNALSYVRNHLVSDTISDSILESVQLKYIPFQRQMRNRVFSYISPLLVRNGLYRRRTQIEHEKRKRERIEVKQQIKASKKNRKQQKLFLHTVLTHCREFHFFHRMIHKCQKRISNELNKQDSADLQQRRIEKQRLRALKAQDEQAYMILLREHKNQRILTILSQTEKFLQHISSMLEQERGNEFKDEDQIVNPEDIDLTESRTRYYQLAHNIMENIDSQPQSLTGGTLRGYQLYGVKWLLSLYNNNLNGILADEMGLGKTVQTIALFAYLIEQGRNFGPFLIIAPLSTLRNNWEYEMDRWLPSGAAIVYDGPRSRRRTLRDSYLAVGNFNFLLTTYEFAMRDKRYLRKIPWRYIVVDEAHRLKNPKCKLISILNNDFYQHDCRRLALTGTPLQNDLPELWSLLNFLHPQIFGRFENFDRWFGVPFTGMVSEKEREVSEMTEEEELLIIHRLHSLLRPFLLRREKKNVEKQLPQKIEKILRCKLSSLQHLIYHKISQGEITLQNPIVQWTKACTHPYLFHPSFRYPNIPPIPTSYDTLVRSCGKMELLDRLLTKFYFTDHRVLIFCQYVMTLDMIQQYLIMRNYSYVRLDGSVSQEDRKKNIQTFCQDTSDVFVFLLTTKAGGLGLNLQAADTVILYESDWNPQNDIQAQSRVHRIGQDKQVLVLRLITAGTIEEKILYTSLSKLKTEEVVMSAGMFNNYYSFSKSRIMAAEIIRQGRIADQTTVQDYREVCKAIARSDEELQLFLQMDQDRLNTLKKPLLCMESEIPYWAHNYPLYDLNELKNQAVDENLPNYNKPDSIQEKVMKGVDNDEYNDSESDSDQWNESSQSDNENEVEDGLA